MKPRYLYLLLPLFVLLLSFQNCSQLLSPQSTELASNLSNTNVPTFTDIQNEILIPKCVSCHSAGTINFTSYDAVMASGTVIANKPSSSSMYLQVVAGYMPKDSSPLTSAQRQSLYLWIQNGALGNSAPAVAPSAPVLAAMSASAGSTILSWTFGSTATVSSIKVERATNSAGPFSVIATLNLATTTYTDGNVLPLTQYYYRISASNSYGSSGYSNVVSVTTSGYPPSAPSNLAVTSTTSTAVSLSWADQSSDETFFQIERATSSAGPFAIVTKPAANTTSYTDSGLTAATTYYYRVSAGNTSGNSTPSNVVSTTTQAMVTTAPTAPSGLTAVAISSAQINLSWTDNSNNETGFSVQRATSSGGPFSVIGNVGAGVTTFSSTGLSASTTYYYRVYASNSVGDSAVSNTANAMTSAPAVTVSAAPSSLTATAISTSSISLSWSDNSNNENGFKIERATNSGGPFSLITTTAGNVTSYSDSSLTASTTYYYRVSSYNSAGTSSPSNTATATTFANVPTAPSALTANATSGSQIQLAWTDNSNNETGFKVERSTASAGPFTLVGQVGAGVTSYTDSGLTVATTYYYRVSAYNSGGNSTYTTIASAMTSATYSWLATNVFQPNCYSCHTGSSPKAGYNIGTYAGVLTRVTAGDALGSTLYQRVQDGSMPPGSAALTTSQVNAVKSWINSGAPNN